MTAVAGVAAFGRVWIGGDSAQTAGYSMQTARDIKVFMREQIAFGCSGSIRVEQIVRYEMPLAGPLANQDAKEWCVVSLVKQMRESIASAKVPDDDSWRVLVGVRGRLFCVCSDYGVSEPDDGVNVIGSGEDVTIGALSAFLEMGERPDVAIRRALGVAEKHNNTVRGPFTVVCTEAIH